MSTFNKKWEYKGYEFETTVELDARIEKHIGGRRWHRLNVKITKDYQYATFDEVLSTDLFDMINQQEQSAKDYVDGAGFKPQIEEENKLLELGFTETK